MRKFINVAVEAGVGSGTFESLKEIFFVAVQMGTKHSFLNPHNTVFLKEESTFSVYLRAVS